MQSIFRLLGSTDTTQSVFNVVAAIPILGMEKTMPWWRDPNFTGNYQLQINDPCIGQVKQKKMHKILIIFLSIS